MENIVNLEQLDYRDQLIKDYIDEHMPDPHTGSSITCELYVYTNKEAEQSKDKNRLYIRCGKGQLLETDTLQFARNKVSNCTWLNSEQKKVRRKKKGRGWIIPRHCNQVPLTKVFDSEMSTNSSTFDYWEVKPMSPEGEVWEWEDLINAFLSWRNQNASYGVEYDREQEKLYDEESGKTTIQKTPSNPRPVMSSESGYYNTYAEFINRWCGLAVVRDGANITPYMLWKVEGGWKWDNPGTGYFVSPYLVNGCNREEWMNDENDNYEGLTGGWDGRKSSFVFVLPK